MITALKCLLVVQHYTSVFSRATSIEEILLIFPSGPLFFPFNNIGLPLDSALVSLTLFGIVVENIVFTFDDFHILQLRKW